jgi:acyl carrier protein
MTREDIHARVVRHLGRLAPEADLKQLDANVGLREQLDLDSIDFLNFIIALHKELQIDVPESDYPKLATLRGCVDYLAAQVLKTQGS